MLDPLRQALVEHNLDVRLLVSARNQRSAHRADTAALAELGVTVHADSDTHGRPALAEAHRYFHHAMDHADMEFVLRPAQRELDRSLGARWRRRWPLGQRLSVLANDDDWQILVAAATVGPVLWSKAR